MCKQIYLPVDEKRGKAKTAALNELSHRFAAAAATSYYCVKTGLVRIPKSVRCTRLELAQLERRIFDGAVPPQKLVALRDCNGRRDSITSFISHAENGHHQEQQHQQDHDLPIIETTDSYSSTDDLTSASLDLTTSVDSSHGSVNGGAPGETADEHGDDADEGPTTDLELGSTDGEGDSDNLAALGPLYHELLPAADYLEQSKSAFLLDNRCCVKADDDCNAVEVQETTSQRPVFEEEDHSSSQVDSV